MIVHRLLSATIACITLFACAACAPSDPQSRIKEALATLQSGAGGSAKREACTELRNALAEYPIEAADRAALVERAAGLLVAALENPACRIEAEETIVAIGLPTYDALFRATREGVLDTQEAAVTCLLRMSATAVPVLMPRLLSEDIAAQDEAATIMIRMGSPIAPTLRDFYLQVLEPFDAATAPGELSGTGALTTRGKSSLLAFARVFAVIGDRASIIALLDGCEKLQRRYPEVAAIQLKMIDGLGPDALTRLGAAERFRYDKLKLLLGK